jgi:hypothetical protein
MATPAQIRKLLESMGSLPPDADSLISEIDQIGTPAEWIDSLDDDARKAVKDGMGRKRSKKALVDLLFGEAPEEAGATKGKSATEALKDKVRNRKAKETTKETKAETKPSRKASSKKKTDTGNLRGKKDEPEAVESRLPESTVEDKKTLGPIPDGMTIEAPGGSLAPEAGDTPSLGATASYTSPAPSALGPPTDFPQGVSAGPPQMPEGMPTISPAEAKGIAQSTPVDPDQIDAALADDLPDAGTDISDLDPNAMSNEQLNQVFEQFRQQQQAGGPQPQAPVNAGDLTADEVNAILSAADNDANVGVAGQRGSPLDVLTYTPDDPVRPVFRPTREDTYGLSTSVDPKLLSRIGEVTQLSDPSMLPNTGKASQFDPNAPVFGPTAADVNQVSQPVPVDSRPVFGPTRADADTLSQPVDGARTPFDPSRPVFGPTRADMKEVADPVDPVEKPTDTKTNRNLLGRLLLYGGIGGGTAATGMTGLKMYRDAQDTAREREQAEASDLQMNPAGLDEFMQLKMKNLGIEQPQAMPEETPEMMPEEMPMEPQAQGGVNDYIKEKLSKMRPTRTL